jgi:hypothetical protein
LLQRVAALTEKTFRFGIGIVPGLAGRGVLNERVQAMNVSTIVMTGLVLVGSAALAAANPAMLPKQSGYPSGGEYANDTGKKSLTVEQSLRA